VTGFHLAMAVLATCRLTEVVVHDEISKPIRKRFPYKLLTCDKCISVWMGLVATLLFVYFPWANWPFGLSMFHMMHNSIMARIMRVR
jgi:hypothetical protein